MVKMRHRLDSFQSLYRCIVADFDRDSHTGAGGLPVVTGGTGTPGRGAVRCRRSWPDGLPRATGIPPERPHQK